MRRAWLATPRPEGQGPKRDSGLGAFYQLANAFGMSRQVKTGLLCVHKQDISHLFWQANIYPASHEPLQRTISFRLGHSALRIRLSRKMDTEIDSMQSCLRLASSILRS